MYDVHVYHNSYIVGIDSRCLWNKTTELWDILMIYITCIFLLYCILDMWTNIYIMEKLLSSYIFQMGHGN